MALIFIRTVIIFIATLILMRLMGKRQIGEMQPYELVITLIIAEIECLGFIKRRVVYTENAGRLERRKVSMREHVKLLRLMESGAPADEIEAYARQHKENALHYRHELK